jgi:cytochrome c553
MVGFVQSAARAADAHFTAARAILETNCVSCHGGKSERSELNLVTRDGLLRGGAHGPAIIAGNSAGSLLFKKVTHADEPGMPFKREKLSEAEIATLAKWIDGGAVYDEPLSTKVEPIWSLKPLTKPAPPDTQNKSWAKTPIDQFILAKLEEKGMKPSAAADKRTLLRRVTLDLTGLAPTADETKEFLADESPGAFAKVVDRLLASPRYGERWARHWMDTVHYADTHGHSQDRVRPNAWPYRDYLIRSFNNDKPFVRFVEEQVAGDRLFPDDPDGIVALGFIAAGSWDDSSQVFLTEDSFDKRQAQNLDRDDMVATTMSTFVSTTVQCARCHNHKFDPIPQKEYYDLQAVFAGVDRIDRPYDTDPKINATRQALLKRRTALDVNLKGPALLEPSIQSEVAAWEKGIAYKPIDWRPIDLVTFTSEGGATLTKQADGSILAGGTRAENDVYTVTAQTDRKGITAIRLDVLADENLPLHGPGRADNGNLTLTEIRLLANGKAVALQNPSADFNQVFNGVDWGVTKALDGDSKTGWSVYPEIGRSHVAVFETAENIGADGVTTLKFVLEQKWPNHSIGKFRLSVTIAPRPVQLNPFPENIAKVLETAPAARTDEQRIELAAYYLRTRIDQQLKALPTPQMVYAVNNDFEPRLIFKPAKTPRPIFLLKRGDINKPDKPAAPGALSCVSGINPQFELPDLNDEAARRAALAKWITDPKNVLTWRSIVNRVWHYHFGRGIVDSPNDFGEMGSRPTHPQLLDWLASTFLESGGSIKQLHRMILSSAAYQQSSAHNADFAAIDSGNQYLWRMNRSRLDSEQVRDGILQITGKLDLTMGGPAVQQFTMKDPSPPVTPMLDYGKFDIDSAGSFRRSIYRFIFRTVPDPFMDTLDCADASQLTPTRNVSMTALQALAMLNNQFVLKQSEHLAVRVAGAGDLQAQVAAVYQLVLGRAPRPEESKDVCAYATEHGMANACRILLNSNEFMFVN